LRRPVAGRFFGIARTLAGGGVQRDRLFRLFVFGAIWNRKLETELNARVVKSLDGGEGNVELFGNLIEGQADVEIVVMHIEAPVLMLKHDGHLGIFSQERNVEMMFARQARCCGHAQGILEHAAQRVLHHQVVTHQILGHGSQKLSRTERTSTVTD